MPNTSATGGFLTQVAGPVEGLSLRRFIGSVIVGISGVAGDLVRPMWQKNPPPIPDIDTNWIAFGIAGRRGDNAAYHVEDEDGLGSSLARHEELDIQLIFYGPDCLQIAGELRDGFELTQNTESLQLAGMGFVRMEDITHAPELYNGRYFDRADATLVIRREVRREYQVLSFVSANGQILANRATETLSLVWSA